MPSNTPTISNGHILAYSAAEAVPFCVSETALHTVILLRAESAKFLSGWKYFSIPMQRNFYPDRNFALLRWEKHSKASPPSPQEIVRKRGNGKKSPVGEPTVGNLKRDIRGLGQGERPGVWALKELRINSK